MRNASDLWNLIEEILGDGRTRGVLYRTAEDDAPDGRTITLGGRRLLHFGSCGYLGLELDQRLREGAAELALRYGTQFPSSRGYVSAKPYLELEGLLGEIFGLPVLTAQTTTLAHVAALPVLVGERDVVLLDQRVHNCVHMAVNHVRVQGTTVELLRHNRTDLLAERVEALRGSHRRVWYLADGVYSMGGETAPLDELAALLDRYEQLHVYLDDAHGMSWTGRHGRGFAARLDHPRAYVATSLSKGFGAAGAVLLLRDPAERRRVATIGPSMIFSGPLQPPQLGASIASARIHLTGEIAERGAALLERIRLCNRLMLERELALVCPSETPVRCVGVGAPRTAYAVVARLEQEGFYVNSAVYPAVPKSRSGIRFTLTTHLTPQDIERFADTLARVVPEVLASEGFSPAQAKRSLGLGNIWGGATAGSSLALRHETTVEALDAGEWDRLLGDRGSFTCEGLRFLERTFRDNPEPENLWRFHYYLVRDPRGRPVLATFFTEALWKDDMLASEEVSRRAEELRRGNPYFLTSRALSMGSLLTEGAHLWLDREADWRRAMLHLLEAVGAEQSRAGVANLVLRDLPDDPELDAFLKEQGFLRFAMPPSMVVEVEWADEAGWLARLSRRARRHQLEEVLPFADRFEVEHLGHGGRPLGAGERARLHALYLGVKDRSLAINTFPLPERFFDQVLEHPCWELLLMRTRPEHGGEPGGAPVAMGLIFRGQRHCVPLLAGLDYRASQASRAYRVLLVQTLRRCERLGARRVRLGFGAEVEKQRLGATPTPGWVYVQGADQYHSEILAQLRIDATQRERPAG